MSANQRPSPQRDNELLALADLLSARGRFGVAWLDRDLIVTRTYGAIAQHIQVGDHITSGVLALIGQEDQLAALATSDDPQLTLGNVAVIDGDGKPIRINVNVLFDATLGYVVVLDRVLATSVAALMVEDEIRRRRIADAELARINRQLEEFAYVISHDLKAPLRALRYYASDIGEALHAEPPDLVAAGNAADHLTIATKRMSNMLVGLLEYSRIGRQDDTIEMVDTAAMVADITANLALPDAMSIAVEGAWPHLRTTPVPLDLVLRNLIDNAVKHHDRDAGIITISARDTETSVVFTVADDGPGIDPDWHQAIFQPFNRVDDRKHPDSSGIGLALVKRSIEAAGGRIEVASDPAIARGTTFRVTWPKR